jgi:hypothetical protein
LSIRDGVLYQGDREEHCVAEVTQLAIRKHGRPLRLPWQLIVLLNLVGFIVWVLFCNSPYLMELFGRPRTEVSIWSGQLERLLRGLEAVEPWSKGKLAWWLVPFALGLALLAGAKALTWLTVRRPFLHLGSVRGHTRHALHDPPAEVAAFVATLRGMMPAAEGPARR